jgi:hypothetical protein
MKKSIKRYSTALPMDPVRSGDPITTIAKATFIEMMPELQGDIIMDDEIAYIIKGWSLFNAKKVIVASIDEVVTLEIDGIGIQVKFNGYNLYDSETFQVVDGNLLIVMTSAPSGDNKFSGKIFMHQSSKL